MVVLDTCALIELCLSEPQLSAPAIKALEKKVFISSISFAEIALKVARGKLRMNLKPKQLYNAYKAAQNISIVDVTTDQWFGAIDLKWRHQDPADRIITYLATSLKAPIVTKDRIIKKFYQEVLW